MRETKAPPPTNPGTFQRIWWYMFQSVARYYNWPGNYSVYGLLWPLTDAEETKLKHKINQFLHSHCNGRWTIAQTEELAEDLFFKMLEPPKDTEGDDND